jgi:hypothetical protein
MLKKRHDTDVQEWRGRAIKTISKDRIRASVVATRSPRMSLYETVSSTPPAIL